MALTYTDNGTNTPNGVHLVFTYTFEPLEATDVKVSLNGVVQATTKYTVSTSPKQIEFNATSIDSTLQEPTTGSGKIAGAPKSGVAVRVFRETDVTTAKHTYQSGSSIRANDLNKNQQQVRFALAERQEQENIYTFDSKYRVEPAYPNTDNDEGDLVYNTSTDSLKVYDGSTWKTITPTDAQLADIGVVAGDLGVAADYGSVEDAVETSTSSSINTVATYINNVNTFVKQYKIAASEPSDPDEGDLWYDSGSNVLKYHNGSSFVTVSGSVLDEDNMNSNSDTVAPSQQSVKAYVDSLAWLDDSAKTTGSVIHYDGGFKADANQTLTTIVDGGSWN